MNELLLFSIIGIPVIYFGGVAFHFLYKYGGKKRWMIVISPVNESIWEHLKLAFYPTLLFSIIGYFVLRSVPTNFFTAEIIGIYSMIITILIIEWIYPKITKKNILIIDLIVFFVAIALGQFVSYLVMTTRSDINFSNQLLIIIVIAQTFFFTILSIRPPRLNLFRDSMDGLYGIKPK